MTPSYVQSRRELFRSSRPDSIETGPPHLWRPSPGCGLFRSSRPDSIETSAQVEAASSAASYCSGLLGRTPLRRELKKQQGGGGQGLFRSSRPDSIETE